MIEWSITGAIVSNNHFVKRFLHESTSLDVSN